MSNIKEKLAQQQIVYGTMLSEITTPNIARIFKVCGFDYFIIDCEHGYFDYTSVANIVAVAAGADLPAIVRIPRIDRECILKYLELGASGILVPMTSTAADIKKAVEFSKYLPLGNRGVSTLRAHTGYNPGNMAEYMKKANEATLIIAQIESAQGLKNIEAILAVPGLDGIVVGPNDMSMEMGILGQYHHPMMQQAMAKVAAAAQAAGRWSGIISSNKQLLQECSGKGMQFISWNSELGMITESAKAALKTLRE